MPPRLPTQRTLFLAASGPSGSRSGPQTLSGSSARRALATIADRRATGGLHGARLSLRTACQEKRTFHSTPRSHAAAKNPYEVLGLKKDAGASEIKKSYYQLAKQYHPDTNKDKGAHERFVEIQAAYDLLSDDKKRAAYDRYGAAAQQEGFDADAFASGRGPFGGAGFGFQDFGSAFGTGGGQTPGELFETLFGSAFGGRGGGRGAETYRGDDIEASVGVSFLEACKGVQRTVTVTPVVDCGGCGGSGLKAGAKRGTCGACGGTGTRTFVIESGFQMASTCAACQGSGTTVPRGAQCGGCSGMGKVKTRKTVPVSVPAGVEDGMTLRVAGAGDMPIAGKGSAGDLLVRVRVGASKVFRRQGVNVYHDARIAMHTAVLGGKVRVPTLEGEVDVRVPAGTQQGEECVLRGRGVAPVGGGEKGDLYVAFSVQVPRALSKRQREMLEAYAADVEGGARKDAPSTPTPPPTPTPDAAPAAPAAPPLSRAWTRLKRLIGTE